MLTYDDCVGLCGLRPEEIDAIARHEHLPEIVPWRWARAWRKRRKAGGRSGA